MYVCSFIRHVSIRCYLLIQQAKLANLRELKETIKLIQFNVFCCIYLTQHNVFYHLIFLTIYQPNRYTTPLLSKARRKSCSKGLTGLVAITSIRQSRPFSQSILFQLSLTFILLSFSAIFIQLSLPMNFKKSSQRFSKGPCTYLEILLTLVAQHTFPNKTPRKSLRTTGTIRHTATVMLETSFPLIFLFLGLEGPS